MLLEKARAGCRKLNGNSLTPLTVVLLCVTTLRFRRGRGCICRCVLKQLSHERELSKVVIIIGRAGDTHANKGKSVLSVARYSDMYNQQRSISNYRSRGRTLPFLLFSKSGSRYQRTFARPLPGMPRTALASRGGINQSTAR